MGTHPIINGCTPPGEGASSLTTGCGFLPLRELLWKPLDTWISIDLNKNDVSLFTPILTCSHDGSSSSMGLGLPVI
jgi:hypothetical protein